MANAEVDVVDYEDDDMEDAVEVDAPKIRSAITDSSSAPLKTKGRGFREAMTTEAERNTRFASKDFDSLASDGGGPAAQRSIEGWIVLVTGIHEEAQEDDLHTAFGEFGEVKNMHLNLDRRTGFVKGYALMEFEQFDEAQAAISAMNGAELLTQIISVDWAFSSGPFKQRNIRRRSPRGHRSRSPRRRF
ncbi:hypothetical protein MKW98_016042 [Papaver atlanticum]|uniref:RNA-binding protein 8A n=1 Tax=Papaver atlanticum TaxID=357466 RepID=A0AAD4RVG4_9MAGN|nr:hypothetical protein MKW98_016042 [Papaver atlanticum]